MLGNFTYFLWLSMDFFKMNFKKKKKKKKKKKNLSGIPSENQTVWIKSRPDVLSGLIWVQTVCKVISYFFQRFQKQISRNTIRVSNSLDPDQTRCFVGSDLVPNCLQRLSVDDKSHH